MAKDCDSLEMILFKLSNTWVSCDTPSPPRGPQSDKCSKVPVVTHEMSAIKNEGRHIDDVFRPYPVHYILGRSYKAQPTCPPGQCLYFTWKVQPLGNLGHGSLEYWHLLVCSLFLRRPVIFQTHPHENKNHVWNFASKISQTFITRPHTNRVPRSSLPPASCHVCQVITNTGLA